MAAKDEERNLKMEIDEMKEMMNEMKESQRRMEEMLLAMKETLTLIRAAGSMGVTEPYSHPTYVRCPPPLLQNHPQPRPDFHNQGRFRPQNLPPFPKLSISNAELFQRLFDVHLISGNPVGPLQPPFQAWYNPSLTCKYHMDIPGHSIEDCESFKTAVRKLIAYKKLDIEEVARPRIVNNS